MLAVLLSVKHLEKRAGCSSMAGITLKVFNKEMFIILPNALVCWLADKHE